MTQIAKLEGIYAKLGYPLKWNGRPLAALLLPTRHSVYQGKAHYCTGYKLEQVKMQMHGSPFEKCIHDQLGKERKTKHGIASGHPIFTVTSL